MSRRIWWDKTSERMFAGREHAGATPRLAFAAFDLVQALLAEIGGGEEWEWDNTRLFYIAATDRTPAKLGYKLVRGEHIEEESTAESVRLGAL